MSYFQVNGGSQINGILSNWQRVEKRRTQDGIEWQDYALNTWNAPTMDMSIFEELRALSGRVLTSIRTTTIDDRNTFVTYSSGAEMDGPITGQQVGQRMTNVNVTWRVKV